MGKKTKSNSPDDTRQLLIDAAKLVFAAKGFAGATVKEIADEAGVNVSLISYHFQGKEGLLRTCLESFGRQRLQDSEAILTPADSPADFRAKLRLWMSQFLRCHVEDASVCTILHRENLIENKFIFDLFQGTLFKTYEAVVKFFEQARKKGILRKEVNAEAAADLVFGFMVHMGRNQALMQKMRGFSIADEKYRTQVGEQTIEILLHGVLREAV